MAQLHLQGGNVMEIPNSSAEVIKSELGTSQAPTFYDIGPVKVKTSTILRVVVEGRQIIDEKYLKWRDKVEDWNEYRKNLYSYSPEKKAELNMHYYRLLWFAYAGDNNIEREEEARFEAEKFFQDNPNRCVMDYRKWKLLMPHILREEEEYETMMTGTRKSVLRLLERQLGRETDDLYWKPNLPPETTVEEDEIKVSEIPF